MAEFGLLNWSVVFAYLIANLGLGWYMSRRVSTSEDYYLGDRSSPWWAIGISVVATYVSALSFLGGPAWAYGDGMAALAIHINYSLVVFACIVFFIPFFYNSGVASIYDYLERRFGIASRAVMGILFMVTMALGAASIMTATAVVVTFVTGLSTTFAIVLMTTIVVAYTMLGGMNAVIWTDVLQGIILIIGAGIIMVALLGEIGALPQALTFLDQHGKLNPINLDWDPSIAPTIWAGVFAMTLYHITVYGANQFMVQRALAAKNIGEAKKSYMVMGYAAFFLYFSFFLIGALLYVYYEGKPFKQPNEIILVFANALAIPGLLGIIGAAILSASMSTTSSAFNSLSTVSVTDFYQKFFHKDANEKHYLGASRVFTVLWGLAIIPIAIEFASSTGSILEVISKVGSYLVGAKLAMFGMGFFSKHTSERGLLIGVVAGLVGLMFFAPLDPIAPAVDGIWLAMGAERPEIAWPWFVVIAGGINIAAAWIASVVLDGFQQDWHEHSVPGQILAFEREGKPMMSEGWYVVPGKVEPVVWTLPLLFACTLGFLAWFGTLG
ncbi:sodium/solute symporter [Pseudomaricurvus alkylphenolicus]|jgi:SSS family solute:Na+ symporter|uniref:sodium:solute symporter family transporter n=1 Tax=Pseudomaricurvus alkylphenolicus TaxID=1306991 RepID=UPI0014236239|nr:sodium/solute symporter [Pseudomaricurvus alkylphenolicus]NIB40355.1 sodium/solute symporter [Pseudomaricurvus alkylphenolicus]